MNENNENSKPVTAGSACSAGLGAAFGGYHEIRAHIVAEDPRYPMLCINGKFNYGLRINPATGDIAPDRLCICGAGSDGGCICDL